MEKDGKVKLLCFNVDPYARAYRKESLEYNRVCPYVPVTP